MWYKGQYFGSQWDMPTELLREYMERCRQEREARFKSNEPAKELSYDKSRPNADERARIELQQEQETYLSSHKLIGWPEKTKPMKGSGGIG